MYVAIDDEGNKIIPFEFEDRDQIRILSERKKLFCPECGNRVVFHAGSRKTEHFKHWRLDKCENDSEAETEEHIKGKILIYDYLKRRYPGSHVEFEYKIIETGQRADVICIHENGECWAFEMQCSEILGEAWWSRHLLYKEAGIKDFWLLGESVHRAGQTNNQLDECKHKFVSLASEIYKRHGAVYFLNVETEDLRLLYKMNSKPYYQADTIFIIDNIVDNINNVFQYKNYMVNDQTKQKLVAVEEAERKDRVEKERLNREALEREAQRELEQKTILNLKRMRQQMAIEDAKSLFSTDIPLLSIVNKTKRLQDKALFEQLLEKYHLTDANFPGFLSIWTYCGHLIQVPPQLWQLWIYDKFIHNKLDTKVWLPTIKDEIVKIFKVSRTSREEGIHFSFAIWSFFRSLGFIDISIQLGGINGNYQRILFDKLPVINDKSLNRKMAMALSYCGVDDNIIYEGFINQSISNVFQIDEHSTDRNSILTEELRHYKERIKEEVKKRKDEKKIERLTIDEHKQLIKSLHFHLSRGNITLNEYQTTFITSLFINVSKNYIYTEKQIKIIRQIKAEAQKQLKQSINVEHSFPMRSNLISSVPSMSIYNNEVTVSKEVGNHTISKEDLFKRIPKIVNLMKSRPEKFTFNEINFIDGLWLKTRNKNELTEEEFHELIMLRDKCIRVIVT